MNNLTPKFIIKDAYIAAVYDMKKSVLNLAASTYGAITQWNNFKKDKIDIEIEVKSKKIKGHFINEEDEFRALENKLHLLVGKENGTEDKLLKKVEELIAARRDFSLLKEDSKFPWSFKINAAAITFVCLSFIALKTNITNNPNYFIRSLMAETAYLAGSIAYRIIWEKCWFQPSLKDEAESIRKMAKEIYTKFLSNPPDIRTDLSTKKIYETKLKERQIEREKKAGKRSKPLRITNG
ncbi:MAG: hypothetical protein H0U49_10685 [Parachlamydiaceae bacterium]|nr:hypothetical protein [Parachlamydiaceae bacterium]